MPLDDKPRLWRRHPLWTIVAILACLEIARLLAVAIEGH